MFCICIKSIKSTKSNFHLDVFTRIKKKTSDFHSDVFYAHTKHKIAQKLQYAHTKHTKAQKSQKAQNVKQAIFFFLDAFLRIKILSFLCT